MSVHNFKKTPKFDLADWFEELHAPVRDFLTASEVISWIASRKPLPIHEWRKEIFGLKRNWHFIDEFGWKSCYSEQSLKEQIFFNDPNAFWPGTSDNLLTALKCFSEGSEYKLPVYLADGAHEVVRQYLDEISSSGAVSFQEILISLENDLRIQRPALATMQFAAGELRRELFFGNLSAWGRSKHLDGYPEDRFSIDKAFWIPGKTIHFDGKVSEDGQSGFSLFDLIFDTAEVVKVWTIPYREIEAEESDNTTSTGQTTDTPKPNLGGRPPLPELESFIRELVKIADTPDGLPDERRLFEHMQRWATMTYTGGGPSRSTLQNWLARYDYRRKLSPK